MAKQLGISDDGKLVDLRYHCENKIDLTLENVQTASVFEHRTLKNADGSPVRARRNGKTQTWKTRPSDFRIPAKYGLKQCFNITPANAKEWYIPG